MKFLSQLAACASVLLIACGGQALEADRAQPTASTASALTSKTIYFGNLEVRAGQLKSADGTLPQPGEAVSLRLFLPELASFLCRDYCMALSPQLHLRYKGTDDFQEVPGLPKGSYYLRGPQAYWPTDQADILLFVPADADRIEVYMYWGRTSWNGATCYLAYDVTECPDSFGIDGAYLSNYGRNFLIAVRP